MEPTRLRVATECKTVERTYGRDFVGGDNLTLQYRGLH